MGPARLRSAAVPSPGPIRCEPASKKASASPTHNITRIELHTVGDVPGVDAASFIDLAQRAKDSTVARALAGTEITLEASVAVD